MAKVICSAGVVRSTSYFIVEKDNHDVIASIKNNEKEITTHHVDVERAHKWAENQLKALTNYETY